MCSQMTCISVRGPHLSPRVLWEWPEAVGWVWGEAASLDTWGLKTKRIIYPSAPSLLWSHDSSVFGESRPDLLPFAFSQSPQIYLNETSVKNSCQWATSALNRPPNLPGQIRDPWFALLYTPLNVWKEALFPLPMEAVRKEMQDELETDRRMFKCWPWYLLAVWPWTTNLTSLKYNLLLKRLETHPSQIHSSTERSIICENT